MSRKATLQRWLEPYRPADPEETRHRAAMLDLLLRPGCPLDRATFEPGHFTASAFVLAPDRHSLLLVRHAKLRRWLQPGGHVEPRDADLLAAALREAEEETGLPRLRPAESSTVLDLDVHPIPAHRDEPPHLHFDVRFLLISDDRAAIAGDGAERLRWVAVRELPRWNPEAAARRVAGKLARMQASGANAARPTTPDHEERT